MFEELRLVGDLHAELDVIEAGEGILRFEGKLSGVQNLTCSRSLEVFPSPFEVEMLFEAEKDPSLRDQILEDEDDELFRFRIPMTQDYVDITECVRQLVTLQEPMHPVKDPSQEFSWKDPAALSAEDRPVDPRWEKLKDWKKE